MVAAADRVEWVVVATEVDALLLEHSLIQTHQPRFNVRLKDDKTYPWLAISLNEEWPRPFTYRGKRRKGVQYFGPYPHVRSLRQTIDLMVKSYPVRTCTDTKFARHQKMQKACLLFDIGKCSGPCIGAVEHEVYDGYVRAFQQFFAGDTEPMLEQLHHEMSDAAAQLAYEKAARLRDRITAVAEASQSQEVVVDASGNFDAFGLSANPLEVSVAIFHVRHGRVVGRHGVIVDRAEDQSDGEILATVLERVYADPVLEVPRQVLVSTAIDPERAALLEQWLERVRSGPVTVTEAHRGRRRQVLEMAVRNATEDLARHQLRRASDHNSRSKALTQLQHDLQLVEAPLRIECYDMSHLQGTDYVGSMVVFEDGLPKRSDYRHFLIKTVDGNDDFAAMAEVLRRRLRRLDDEPEVPITKRRFAYRPQLLLIDGGKGQLSAVTTVLDELELSSSIEVASLAKQFEEVYRPGRSIPMHVARGSEALFLLQRIRDEAHRFAITFHRQRRGARMTASVLDGVAGLGPTRRTKLLDHFGTMRDLRAASREDLAALVWLPERVATALFAELHPDADDGAPDETAGIGGRDE